MTISMNMYTVTIAANKINPSRSIAFVPMVSVGGKVGGSTDRDRMCGLESAL
jgi:hypothetical protein